MELALTSYDSFSLEQAANAMPGPKTAGPHRQSLTAEGATRVGKMIQDGRTAKNMTYADMAREIWGEITDAKGHTTGRNRNLVPTWERGKSLPRQSILPQVASVLDLDLQALTEARQQDEADRRGALMPEPDFTAGAVTGRPDLVLLSVKAIIPIEDFPKIVNSIAASARGVIDDEEAEDATEQ